jgi:hypothetical protein
VNGIYNRIYETFAFLTDSLPKESNNMSDNDKKTNLVAIPLIVVLAALSGYSNKDAPETRERNHSYGIASSTSGEYLPEVLIRLFGEE